MPARRDVAPRAKRARRDISFRHEQRTTTSATSTTSSSVALAASFRARSLRARARERVFATRPRRPRDANAGRIARDAARAFAGSDRAR